MYKKSRWYLKALKSYPIFHFDQKIGDGNGDDDADTTGGWIIVRSVLTPSRTKNFQFFVNARKYFFLSIILEIDNNDIKNNNKVQQNFYPSSHQILYEILKNIDKNILG